MMAYYATDWLKGCVACDVFCTGRWIEQSVNVAHVFLLLIKTVVFIFAAATADC